MVFIGSYLHAHACWFRALEENEENLRNMRLL
jgi:hypothetical protein